MCDKTAKTVDSNHLKHNARSFHGTDGSVRNAEKPVASELARAGLRSGPNYLATITNFCECCALKREQAPSPQKQVYRNA
ncbi:hypothetical protein SRABI123_04746 [Pseudomonas sp. Bi123]|nr:hypothetical protein SRABI123_04746 [Pseudomonas sp. Bi123]